MESHDLQPERRWPSFRELARAHPPETSWSLFGADDQIGTLNFLTPEVRHRAARLVRTGRTFNLDYPIGAFDPFPTGTRPGARHSMFSNNPWHFDDWLDSFYLQGTTQIDALRHIGHPEIGFYGGRTRDEFSTETTTLGIQTYAEAGIVGRGVLLDVARHLEAEGRPIAQEDGHEIGVDDLEATARRQGVRFQDGDILLVRTGWAEYCRVHMDAAARAAFTADMRVPGLATTRAVVEWLWDRHFSLVAVDNLGVECFPYTGGNDLRIEGLEPPERGVDHNGGIHRHLLTMLGFALGEMWALEDIAADCAADGVYDFLVTAKPLNLPGGVGSPANAMAIK
jgi:kynurenine formamidase